MSHRRMPRTNRWDCLKPENSSDNSGSENKRVNRFKAPSNRAPTNSRWKRSKSPEIKINTFKSRRRGNNYRGGGGRFRNNRRGRGKGPSIFDNAKRDSSGRPIIEGSLTQGFDITSAEKCSINYLIKKDKTEISSEKRKRRSRSKTQVRGRTSTKRTRGN